MDSVAGGDQTGEIPGFLAGMCWLLGDRSASSPAGMVLGQGRQFVGAPLPAGVRRGPMGQCFANAWRLSERVANLAYCEGFALPPKSPLPVLHAWCVDEAGRALDPTWPDGERCAYFGIVLDAVFVRRRMVETGVFGVLGNLWRHPRPSSLVLELVATG